MFTETEYAALLMRLAELGEEKFRAFNEKLMPGTTGTYGVRIPLLRTMAKEIIKNDAKGFLAVAQDDTHEERMLQACAARRQSVWSTLALSSRRSTTGRCAM